MLPQIVSNKSINYLKKITIILIIISSLTSHLVHNTNLKTPLFPGLFSRLTMFVGMTNRWRLFSVVDRFSWRIEIVGIDNQGKVKTLPILNQKKKGFVDKHFIDFREEKLHQNLFIYPDARRHYSDYLCRTYQSKNKQIKSIRYDLFWQQILPPRQAAIRKQYLTEEFSDIGKLGEYQCQN